MTTRRTPLPGQRGNPGRPRGAKGKKLAYLESRRQELVEKLVAMALRGDPTSMRLCIDRLIPRLRAVTTPLNIESKSDELADQGGELIRSAMSGEASVDAVRDMFSALLAQGNLLQLQEFEARMQALERQQDTPPWEQVSSDSDLPLPLRGKKHRSKSK